MSGALLLKKLKDQDTRPVQKVRICFLVKDDSGKVKSNRTSLQKIAHPGKLPQVETFKVACQPDDDLSKFNKHRQCTGEVRAVTCDQCIESAEFQSAVREQLVNDEDDEEPEHHKGISITAVDDSPDILNGAGESDADEIEKPDANPEIEE